MERILESYGLSGEFVLSVFVAIAVFTTFVSVAMPMLSGNELKTRMKAVALERDEVRARERARLSTEKERSRRGQVRQVDAKGLAGAVVEKLNLKNALVDEKTVAKLRVAGLRGQQPLTLFLFARVATPLVLFALALSYIFFFDVLAESSTMVRLVVCLFAAYIGFYLPNIYVTNKAASRKLSIQRAWPDALDLLLICVESGSAIEAAFRRVSDEIGIQSVPLAEELVLLCAELAYLTDRKTAYDNLTARTDMEGVRAVCTALIQAERYGTPLGTALRTLSQESRDARMNIAEKKAAGLPPKLTVPMIIFFLPVLFAVIIGPAVIQIMAR
ncbi:MULTISPECIES: type II secretion system F family protein [unclassified Aureimonas]|uniref:type II secretion system F family protein n=1 Tax=unclassified Aureimonas TaxID=2615206 RepID=UPI0006F9014A|nr:MULTISPECIES: type II secretion system F family protein [unclassified Aureimonas]KQT53863.1 type II secretion system protein [Aureimonas sp. Leaf427]KQT71696.1 type II secretion system protein [Aureimonas sp. Leaf460]